MDIIILNNFKVCFINKYILRFGNDIWGKLCENGLLDSIEIINKYLRFIKNNRKFWRLLCQSGSLNSKEIINKYLEYIKDDIWYWKYLCKSG